MTITVYVRKDDSAPYTVYAEHVITELYEDMLDECYEPVSVAGIAWDPSRVLRELDPIAYRTYRNDYTDQEFHELEMPLAYIDAEDEDRDHWIAREIGDV